MSILKKRSTHTHCGRDHVWFLANSSQSYDYPGKINELSRVTVGLRMVDLWAIVKWKTKLGLSGPSWLPLVLGYSPSFQVNAGSSRSESLRTISNCLIRVRGLHAGFLYVAHGMILGHRPRGTWRRSRVQRLTVLNSFLVEETKLLLRLRRLLRYHIRSPCLFLSPSGDSKTCDRPHVFANPMKLDWHINLLSKPRMHDCQVETKE